MNLSMLSPRGDGNGWAWFGGFDIFVKKKLSFHPWIKIIGQIPNPRQVRVVKCPSNLDCVQNPYPGERPQDQIPTVRPTSPPPLRLNIVRCITAIAVLNLLVSSQYNPPSIINLVISAAFLCYEINHL